MVCPDSKKTVHLSVSHTKKKRGELGYRIVQSPPSLRWIASESPAAMSSRGWLKEGARGVSTQESHPLQCASIEAKYISYHNSPDTKQSAGKPRAKQSICYHPPLASSELNTIAKQIKQLCGRQLLHTHTHTHTHTHNALKTQDAANTSASFPWKEEGRGP